MLPLYMAATLANECSRIIACGDRDQLRPFNDTPSWFDYIVQCKCKGAIIWPLHHTYRCCTQIENYSNMANNKTTVNHVRNHRGNKFGFPAVLLVNTHSYPIWQLSRKFQLQAATSVFFVFRKAILKLE